jgi:hypothetical protein
MEKAVHSMPARAWLPDEAMQDGTIERHLGTIVAEWSAKWIAKGAVRPTGRFAAAADAGVAAAEQAEWLVLEDSLAVRAGEEARLALAGAMLDAPVAAQSLRAEDRRVLDALAAAALDDLCRRLAASFNFPAAAAFERASRLPPGLAADAWACPLAAAAGAPPILVTVAADLAVALRKSCVGRPPSPLALRPLAGAIARQSVSVGAGLGRVGLSLLEFAQLAEGDVLLIDGDPSGTLDLVVEKDTKYGACTLEESGGGGGYQIRILPPPASADKDS